MMRLLERSSSRITVVKPPSAAPESFCTSATTPNTSAKASGSRTKHDDDLEFEYGFYVSGGIAYWFSEKMGLAFDLRYDNAFGEVGTKYVSQNLDAVSGQLQVLFRF